MLGLSPAAQPGQDQTSLACHLLHSCAVQTRPSILVLSPAAPRTCSGPRPASWLCRRPAAGCRRVAASAAPSRCCDIPAGSAPLRRQGCGRASAKSSLQSAQAVSLGQHAGSLQVTDSNGALTSPAARAVGGVQALARTRCRELHMPFLPVPNPLPPWEPVHGLICADEALTLF